MNKEQKLLNERKEMLSKLDKLTKEEMKELVSVEMELSDKGYDIESHEDLWLTM